MVPPRILVTRSPHQASELAARLRSLGAEPILVPAMEIAEPLSFAVLDEALASLRSFHWLIFTSANAVEVFQRRRQNLAVRPQIKAKIAAIGASTARALGTIGLTADLIPPKAVAESLAEALLPHVRQPDGSATRFLLIRAEEAREHLPETLRAAGADVTVAPAYRNVIAQGSVPAVRDLFRTPKNYPDAITFTSSSSVRHLLALCEAAGVELPREPLRISIGPVTSVALREAGYPPHAEAAGATVAALAEATMNALKAVR